MRQGDNLSINLGSSDQNGVDPDEWLDALEQQGLSVDDETLEVVSREDVTNSNTGVGGNMGTDPGMAGESGTNSGNTSQSGLPSYGSMNSDDMSDEATDHPG